MFGVDLVLWVELQASNVYRWPIGVLGQDAIHVRSPRQQKG